MNEEDPAEEAWVWKRNGGRKWEKQEGGGDEGVPEVSRERERERGDREGWQGDASEGVGLRGLARFAGVPLASCDAEHVAVRRAYVRHDYAFTPLSASILAS